MQDKDLMENELLVVKGICDLYLHGAIESTTTEVHTAFKGRRILSIRLLFYFLCISVKYMQIYFLVQNLLFILTNIKYCNIIYLAHVYNCYHKILW